jgi:hypothetical protein
MNTKLRPRFRWEDNIDMNFKETGCEGMDPSPAVDSCENGSSRSGSIKGEQFLHQLSYKCYQFLEKNSARCS